jgi:hypothetical protein
MSYCSRYSNRLPPTLPRPGKNPGSLLNPTFRTNGSDPLRSISPALAGLPELLIDTRVSCQRERISSKRTMANLTSGMSTGCPAMIPRYRGAPDRGGQAVITKKPSRAQGPLEG